MFSAAHVTGMVSARSDAVRGGTPLLHMYMHIYTHTHIPIHMRIYIHTMLLHRGNTASTHICVEAQNTYIYIHTCGTQLLHRKTASRVPIVFLFYFIFFILAGGTPLLHRKTAGRLALLLHLWCVRPRVVVGHLLAAQVLLREWQRRCGGW